LENKVLITGANGFIGSALVAAALGRGYEVWAGVRATSSLARLPVDRIHCIDLKYNDPETLKEQIAAHVCKHGAWDYVIHNAGLTKTLRRAHFFEINAEYTHRLLDALSQTGCKPKKILLMSSLSVYGGGDARTFRPVRLDDPQRPESIYGKSKLLAEKYLCQQDRIPYVILRPTGVYGPGDKDYLMEIRSIRAGFDFAAGMKPQFLTFIYINDLAEVAFRALEIESVQNRAFFVADGDVYTDEQFARLIQEILGKKHVMRLRLPLWAVYVSCLCSELFGRITGRAMTLNTDKYKILKQCNWICDTAPLSAELAFKPAFDLRRGLQETIQAELSK
jgi:nucleoside-diphosphate-sugar epimerase